MAGEIPIDPNPVTEHRKKGDGVLIIERTHEKPVKRIQTHNIANLEKQIAKIDGIIAMWEAKKAPLQAIVDEYNNIKE